uniref:DYW domain-containing protein n=1 Tax=Kalanchoe fedtschenkoi TaxID=63787 RepID=A0A7N0TXL2_KALFE
MDVLSLRPLFKPTDPICGVQFKHNSCVDVSTKGTARPQQLTLTHQPFDEIPERDSYAWNALMRAHLKSGELHSVCSTYCQMILGGASPDKHTLPRVIDASQMTGGVSFGKQVHGHAVKFGFSGDEYVITSLMQMYGRLESVDTARWLLMKSVYFENSVHWTVLAKMYILENKPRKAMEVFKKMMELGVKVDSVALATALAACGMLRSLHEGKKVHKMAQKCNLNSDVLVSNSLLKMYMECGSLKDARAVFDAVADKDVISWTEIIRGYVKNGEFNEALKLFRQMNFCGLKPDSVSVAAVLPACARTTAHKQGKEIHGYLIRSMIDMSFTVLNAIMDMYIKSGYIDYAFTIFEGTQKDVVSWTVMISGLSLHGQGDRAVSLFRELEKTEIQTDHVLYAAVLHACFTSGMVNEGKQYFTRIESPRVTHCALIVALLTRSGLLDEAKLFIKERNHERYPEVIRALLAGCTIHRHAQEEKRLVETLCELEPLNPDNYMLLSNWYACNFKDEMVEQVRETIRDMGLRTKRAHSWIVLRNKVHVFETGDIYHPKSEIIYHVLEELWDRTERECLAPNFSYTLHDVDEERQCVPIKHSELLAITLGIISTQEGATIRVTKNQRVCRNCHEAAKVISNMVGREIILKDPKCFHHFKDGICSCGEFW